MVGYGRRREREAEWLMSCGESHIYEEAKVVRRGLIWVACLLPGAMVKSWPGLLPRVMPESTALLQPWSVWTSMATITTEGKTLRMPGIMAATCSHIGAQESCYCKDH